MAAPVSVQVLGPLEVRRDGEILPIEGLKRRQLLAALVAARGEVVSVERLCEVLWGAELPDSSRASLQSHVSRLRAAVQPALMIEAGPAGYRLDFDAAELDAAVFEELVAPEDGEPSVEALRRGLGLWRGQAFGDLAELPVVRGEALRLEELRLVAIGDLVDARLDTGEDGAVVGELEALVADHPLRERYWRQLMLALHRSGRQGEALRRASTFRTLLRDQLGLDVSTAVQELEARIVADDPALWPATRSGPGDRGPDPGPGTWEPTSLIGRDDDVAAVSDALRDRPVVTICGPGGVGKTRLAELVAATARPRFGQVVVVELAPVRDPDATVQMVARALDVEQRQHLSLEATLAEFISGKELLIVLDNCEHVVAAVAPMVEQWSRRSPGLRVLATGREPLGLPGEHVHLLAPLRTPPAGSDDLDDIAGSSAVQLFVDRARAARPGYRLDAADGPAVAEICRRLDGLPLAIELAAARVRTLGPQALARRLDQRFALLSGQRLADPRHRTLHHLVTWSYELLDPDEQDAFSQLSTFAGTFDLDAVEAVCHPTAGAGRTAVELLVNLVDKSMVTVVDPDEPRYRLLETLREFGHEQLREAGLVDDLAARHRRWYVDLAERASAGLDGPEEGAWSARVDRDLDDFRAAHRSAMAAGDTEAAVGLVVALREHAFRHIRYEIATWADATLTALASLGGPQVAWLTAVSAYGRWVRGDLDAAVELAEQAVAIQAGAGSSTAGLAERVLGNAVFYSGPRDEALRWIEQMVVEARASGSPSRLSHALYMHSVARTSIGDPARGAELAEEARVAAERCGSPTALAQAAYARGLLMRGEDLEGAEQELLRSAAFAEGAGNRWIRAFALTEVHSLRSQRGQPAEALAGFAEVIDIWYRGGDWANQWLSMRHVFGALVRLDAHQAAAVLHGALVAVGAAQAMPIEPGDAERLDDDVDRLRSLLGAGAFAAAVRAGAGMGDREIVAFVQDEIARRSPDAGRQSSS